MGRAAWTSLLLGAVACRGSVISPPTLSGVAPNTVIQGTAARVQVTGENLYVRIVTDLISPQGVRTDVSRYSGTVGGVDLLDVTWVSNTEVAATVPADLPVGVHDLSITTADGDTALLEEALIVEAGSVDPVDPESVVTGGSAVVLDPNTSAIDIPIDPPVDPSTSVLFLTTSNNSVDPTNGHVSGQIVDQGATVRLRRLAALPPLQITIRWSIISHPSFTVQRGTEPHEQAVLSVPIAPVDLSRAFVLASFINSGGMYGRGDWLRCELTSATTLELDSGAPGGTGSEVDWQVVEVAGNAVVQSGNLSLAPSELSATVDLTSPAPRAISFMIFSTSNLTAVNAIASNAIRGQLLSDTQLSFDRGSAVDTKMITWYVLTWDGMETEHGNTTFGVGDASLSETLNCPARESSAVAFLPGILRQGMTTHTADDAVGLVWFTTELRDNGCTLVLERGAAFDSAEAAWTVVWFR